MTRNPHANRNKAKRAAWRILALLLAVQFLFAGGTKLAGTEMQRDNFAHWQLPDWFRYVVGTIEVAAAILLLVPATTLLGAAILLPTMAGAVLTHVRIGEFDALLVPLVLGAWAALVAWAYAPAGVRTRVRPAANAASSPSS